MIPPRDGRVNGQLIENEQPEDRIKCSVQALRQENPEKDDRKTTSLAKQRLWKKTRQTPSFEGGPQNNESRKTLEESGS